MTDASPSYSGSIAVSVAKTLSDTGFERTQFLPAGWVKGASLSSPLVVFARPSGSVIQLAIDDWSVLAPAMHAVDLAPVKFVSVPVAGGEVAELAAGQVSHLIPMTEVGGLTELHEAPSAAFRATRGNGLLEPVQAFEIATAKLPKSTEAERLVVQRIGQDLFRRALFQKWGGRCPITGLDVPELLRASHIKPWAKCDTDGERLDPENGFLLAVQWDAAFDKGFVTFDDAGCVLFRDGFDEVRRAQLGLVSDAQITLTDSARKYLGWHRARVFGAAD
jgi:hypothetical protein